MHDDITVFVGLDVHKDSIAVAVAPAGRSAPRFVGTCGSKLAELIEALSHLGEPADALLAYEAGPSGFALARQLLAAGWRCQVIAVSKVPVRPGVRLKTDRRDAVTLAGYLRAGELTAVVIPDADDEAIRDLSRAREDAVRARLKVRQQINAMLLRHGQHYPGKTRWGPSHERVQRITAALREQAGLWRFGPVVNAIMCLKGIDFVAAVTLIAELGDLHRFEHPKQLMAYLGAVPSEHSPGESRARGSITKTGNSHARRVLVEAAWAYRNSARMSRPVADRRRDQHKAVRDVAWRAQLRLCSRYRRLAARGMHSSKVCVAVARELAAFVREAARCVKPAA